MIFSEHLLFIHVPKTGGTSVARYLLDVLPRPVYYVHPNREEDARYPDVVHVDANWHLTLEQASPLVGQYGFDISRFPVILAVIRNPYDLEVSHYSYLRQNPYWSRPEIKRFALEHSFEEFAVERYRRQPGSIERFFLVGGKQPANLRLARCEQLSSDVRAALRTAGVDTDLEIPWLNRSGHGTSESYYTPTAEEVVYRKYRWIFEEGLYPRMQKPDLTGVDVSA